MKQQHKEGTNPSKPECNLVYQKDRQQAEDGNIHGEEITEKDKQASTEKIDQRSLEYARVAMKEKNSKIKRNSP